MNVELLVYNRLSDPHPMKEGSAYQPGDIVVVKPAGHEWGAAECAPAFLLFVVPGTEDEWLPYTRHADAPDHVAELIAMPAQSQGFKMTPREEALADLRAEGFLADSREPHVRVAEPKERGKMQARRRQRIALDRLSTAIQHDLTTTGRAVLAHRSDLIFTTDRKAVAPHKVD